VFTDIYRYLRRPATAKRIPPAPFGSRCAAGDAALFCVKLHRDPAPFSPRLDAALPKKGGKSPARQVDPNAVTHHINGSNVVAL